jgi:hypothetical protein
MSRKTMVLFIWLIIGAIAAGQRGYFGHVPANCTVGATIAITIVAGPLNYVGIDPHIACNAPKPAD